MLLGDGLGVEVQLERVGVELGGLGDGVVGLVVQVAGHVAEDVRAAVEEGHADLGLGFLPEAVLDRGEGPDDAAMLELEGPALNPGELEPVQVVGPDREPQQPVAQTLLGLLLHPREFHLQAILSAARRMNWNWNINRNSRGMARHRSRGGSSCWGSLFGSQHDVARDVQDVLGGQGLVGLRLTGSGGGGGLDRHCLQLLLGGNHRWLE